MSNIVRTVTVDTLPSDPGASGARQIRHQGLQAQGL
jgi:hypothetical protein